MEKEKRMTSNCKSISLFVQECHKSNYFLLMTFDEGETEAEAVVDNRKVLRSNAGLSASVWSLYVLSGHLLIFSRYFMFLPQCKNMHGCLI